MPRVTVVIQDEGCMSRVTLLSQDEVLHASCYSGDTR